MQKPSSPCDASAKSPCGGQRLHGRAVGWVRPAAASLLIFVAVGLLAALAVVPQSADPPAAAPRTPDVVFVPTPHPVVEKMLALAEIKPGDVVYDLGCGDGRIVVAAAKRYGVKAVGFDINPERVRDSLANVRSNRLEHLVTIKEADIFKLDLREATVVTLYLLPELNVRLMPQLAQLKPGARILSHDFAMAGAKPVQVQTVNAADDTGQEIEHTIYKWVVPWEKENGGPVVP